MKDFIPKVSNTTNETVYLKGSKSISNRVLIIAAMADGVSDIYNLPNSADVIACINALKELGIKVIQSEDKTTIYGNRGDFVNKSAKVYCHESGTLTRFIIPSCAVQSSGEYYIYATDRMMERPLRDQLLSLEKMGVDISYEDRKYSMPLTINSKELNYTKVLKVDGKKSSQFASGLLMAGPYIKSGLHMNSLSDHKQPYLEMTAKVMSEFGVDVTSENGFYKVPNGAYKHQDSYVVEPDISTASYFWAFAAITKSSIKVANTSGNTQQGDINFLKVLEKIGCNVEYHDDGILVTGSDDIDGISVDMRNFSDTFMTLSAVACFANSDTLITGIEHTRGQESDRINAMQEGLQKLGFYVETTIDSILISPSRSTFKPAEVSSHNDHRIAMSLALIGLKHDGVIIDDSQAVSKTCPDYFERMRSLVK